MPYGNPLQREATRARVIKSRSKYANFYRYGYSYMGIGRLLVLGLVIWLIWFLYTRLKTSAVSRKSQKQKTKVLAVKQCAVCAVHVPEEEAIKKGDLYYCSQTHADKDN